MAAVIELEEDVVVVNEPKRTAKAKPQVPRTPQSIPGHRRARAKRPETAVDPAPGKIRRLLGITQEELGRILGYSTRSVAAWEGGHGRVSAPARLKLVEAARLAQALSELMPVTSLGEWLRAVNPAFGGQMPLQLIERGESDRLWEMVHQIDGNAAN